MATKSNIQKDREEIISHVTSELFQSKLRPDVVNSELNQNRLHKAKWFLFDDQVQQRKELINSELTFWKEHTPSCKHYIEKTYALVEPILDIWSGLRPITEKMLVDFIAGWAMSRFTLLPAQLDKHHEDEIIQLMHPPMAVFKEFLTSKTWQEYLVNRCVPETKKIITRFNSFQEDIVHERDALLFFMRDKKAIPFSKKQIEMLRIEYLKKQNQFVEEYRKVANESLTESAKTSKKVGRKKSEPLPVKNYIRKISENNVDIFLTQLKAECQNYSPSEFIYLLNALNRMGYLFIGNNKKEVFAAFELFFEKKYGDRSNKYARWEEAVNADKKGSENQLLSKMLSVVSELIQRNTIV